MDFPQDIFILWQEKIYQSSFKPLIISSPITIFCLHQTNLMLAKMMLMSIEAANQNI